MGIVSSAIVSDSLGNFSINPELIWVDNGATGGYGGTTRRSFWNIMMTQLPAPPADFEVYVLPNTETAAASEGHYAGAHTRQPAVVYNTKKPQPYGQITISKTYDAKKDPVTETTYTESVIKDEYSGYVPKPLRKNRLKLILKHLHKQQIPQKSRMIKQMQIQNCQKNITKSLKQKKANTSLR